jgi:hypothetical protein
MSARIFRTSKSLTAARFASPIPRHQSFFSTTARAMVTPIVDADFISQVTAAEKIITNQVEPVQGGPTARAQQHVGQSLTSQVIHDINEGESVITGQKNPVQGGPTSLAQSILTQLSSSSSGGFTGGASTSSSGPASGVLDSETISKITEKEKELTGQNRPVQGGPTAHAQQHAGEPITSQSLHDITEGEKNVTGGERVKGGPTSTAQSELAKSRQ